MNTNNTLNLCTEADALLEAHADADEITGRARENEQREFARHSYPTLVLAVERLRELVSEVTTLREGIGASETALLRMWSETQIENERLRETMPCGHPRACIISEDTQHYCGWCEDVARMEIAVDNADEFRRMLVECGREVTELKADAKLNAAMLARQCDLAREAEARAALAAHNGETYGKLALERGQVIEVLKTELSRERMRATSRAGRLK